MGFAPPPHEGLPMGGTRVPTIDVAVKTYVWERIYRINWTGIYPNRIDNC